MNGGVFDKIRKRERQATEKWKRKVLINHTFCRSAEKMIGIGKEKGRDGERGGGRNSRVAVVMQAFGLAGAGNRGKRRNGERKRKRKEQ